MTEKGPQGRCGVISGTSDVAGMAGLEPANEGVKVPCLTAWLHPFVVAHCTASPCRKRHGSSVSWLLLFAGKPRLEFRAAEFHGYALFSREDAGVRVRETRRQPRKKTQIEAQRSGFDLKKAKVLR